MSKSMMFALVSVVSVCLIADSAQAGWRRNRCGCAPACQPAYVAPVCSSAPSCDAAPACQSCAASSNAAIISEPAPLPVTTSQSGTAVAATSSNSTYQSFSYEPGSDTPATTTAPLSAAPVAITSVPVPVYRAYRQPTSSFYDSVRGDRKVRGLQ